MPELRTDALTGRTIIVAEERAGRPNDFADVAFASGKPAAQSIRAAQASSPEVISPNCPFCPGQEHRTPGSVNERTDPDGRWRIRVVPNMFPAVTFPNAEAVSSAVGAHEVIIECARHVDRTSALSVSELRDVLETYAERLRHWRGDGRLQYGLVFKNQGPAAGASLAHLHSQLVALPEPPPTVAAELRRAADDFATHQSCPYCRLIREERSAHERIVFDGDGFFAFCPYASWQPFETWLLPADHQPSFERPPSAEALDRLAGVLHELVGRIETVLPEASYNLILRTAPWVNGIDSWCHWRMELLPRVAAFAGLELAAGIHINPLSPEHAARHLRTG